VPRLTLTENQRKVLEKWSRGGSTPYRLVIRSQIVLLASQGHSIRNIAAWLRVNPITVARWRSRFLILGIDGIRHEAPRLGSPPPVSRALVRTILRKTLVEAPAHSSRWSTRSLARDVGVSHSTVRRVWKAYDVRPPKSRLTLLARESRFRPKSIDVIGVYVNPPQRAVAITLRDEESTGSRKSTGARAPPSSRVGLKGGSWMSDLATTLSLLDNREPRHSAARLVGPEFLSFLHTVGDRRRGPERIQLLAQMPGATTSVPLARWLQRHPEFSADVRAGSAPLNRLVIEWFGERLKRQGAQTPPASLPGLLAAVDRWARETDANLRPFAWTRT
jgi:transposase